MKLKRISDRSDESDGNDGCNVFLFNLYEQYVMNMPEDDPHRMDEIRKYAAIYGRFDCKRKPEKPLTLHEVSQHCICLEFVKLYNCNNANTELID